MIKNVGILGAGSWGITLAELLSQKNVPVTIWEYDRDQAEKLSEERTLSFFPHVSLNTEVKVTNDLAETVTNKDIIVFVVPSHTLRDTAKRVFSLKSDLSSCIVVSATKGIENGTNKRMSEIIASEIPETALNIVALSGPTHAEEVAKRIPTACTAASRSIKSSKIIQEIFFTEYFRVYTNSDITGVETAGALKNIFAIAAGLSDGLGLGDNSKSALITRGMREMVKLGVKMGADPSTFFGLAGLGDLMVTCFSRHSRNRAIGEKIGRGLNLSDAQNELIMIAEGVKTAKSAYDLGKKYGLELPIIEQVYEVLYNGKDPKNVIKDLMLREAKPETKLDIGRIII